MAAWILAVVGADRLVAATCHGGSCGDGETRVELRGEVGPLAIEIGDAAVQFDGSVGHDPYRHLAGLDWSVVLCARHELRDVIGVQSRGQQFSDPGDRRWRGFRIAAIAVAVAAWMQQTLLLVVAQQPGGDPGALRQFADQHVTTGTFGLTFTPM